MTSPTLNHLVGGGTDLLPEQPEDTQDSGEDERQHQEQMAIVQEVQGLEAVALPGEASLPEAGRHDSHGLPMFARPNEKFQELDRTDSVSSDEELTPMPVVLQAQQRSAYTGDQNNTEIMPEDTLLMAHQSDGGELEEQYRRGPESGPNEQTIGSTNSSPRRVSLPTILDPLLPPNKIAASKQGSLPIMQSGSELASPTPIVPSATQKPSLFSRGSTFMSFLAPIIGANRTTNVELAETTDQNAANDQMVLDSPLDNEQPDLTRIFDLVGGMIKSAAIDSHTSEWQNLFISISGGVEHTINVSADLGETLLRLGINIEFRTLQAMLHKVAEGNVCR